MKKLFVISTKIHFFLFQNTRKTAETKASQRNKEVIRGKEAKGNAENEIKIYIYK